MIKLTVHESVEAALHKAFPKPAAAAKRALTKYISVVESMLFDDPIALCEGTSGNWLPETR